MDECGSYTDLRDVGRDNKREPSIRGSSKFKGPSVRTFFFLKSLL